jgi:RsiW-degrading membrane proteinase PrsW (M82 family)
MRWTEGQRIRAGETGWQREARQLLADAKDSTRTDRAFEEWKASTEKQLAGDEYLRQMAQRNRPLFTLALSFLLGLLLSLFLSVVADFAWLLARHDIEWLRYASAATLLAALTVFAVAGVLVP